MTNFDNAADKMAKAIDDEIIASLKSPNDIIKEFALQATSKGEWSSVNNRYMEVFDKEKFAELIVWECMSMCDEHRARYFGYRMAASDFTDKNMWAEGEAVCDALRYKMKKRFGVEE